jgi:hypothetical protein
MTPLIAKFLLPGLLYCRVQCGLGCDIEQSLIDIVAALLMKQFKLLLLGLYSDCFDHMTGSSQSKYSALLCMVGHQQAI